MGFLMKNDHFKRICSRKSMKIHENPKFFGGISSLHRLHSNLRPSCPAAVRLVASTKVWMNPRRFGSCFFGAPVWYKWGVSIPIGSMYGNMLTFGVY